MVFDSDKTRGRVAYDQTWTYSMPEAALYLKANNKAKIADVVDMTKEEAKAVADFLIERKKAGQFRTLHSAFEEQVQLLTNREVDIINCWEPATREASSDTSPLSPFQKRRTESRYWAFHSAQPGGMLPS